MQLFDGHIPYANTEGEEFRRYIAACHQGALQPWEDRKLIQQTEKQLKRMLWM